MGRGRAFPLFHGRRAALAPVAAILFLALLLLPSPGLGAQKEEGRTPPAVTLRLGRPDGEDTRPPPTPKEEDPYFSHAGENHAPQEPAFSWHGYFKSIGTLLLVLGGLWYVVWYLKRKGAIPGVSQGSLPKGALRLEGTLPVGPRKGLVVIRFFDRLLLLGMTDQQITLITELYDHDKSDAASRPPSEEPPAAAPGAGRFASLLDALGRRKTPEK